MKIKGTNPVKGTPPEGVILTADFTGAGAAAPTVSASSRINPRDNIATALAGGTAMVTIARTAAGDHTYTFNAKVSPSAVHAIVPVADGTTLLEAKLISRSIDASGQLVCRVQTVTSAGVLTDLGNGVDFLTLVVYGAQSKA